MSKQILVGTVVSDKMNKTRVIVVTRQFRHPIYEKIIRRNKRYYVHDETNQTRVGDKVRIIQSRPLSRLKRWRVESLVKSINVTTNPTS